MKFLNHFSFVGLICAALLPGLGHTASPLTPQEIQLAQAANDHCVAAVWPSIGSNYNSYKACLSERGVTPNVYTISRKYVEDVHRHCWGDDPTLERALSVVTVWAIQNSAPNAVQNLMTFADTLGFIVEISESGIDMQSFLNKGLLNIVDDMLPPTIVDLPPRALSNYAGYKQCLTERNLPGLTFKPSHTKSHDELRVWSAMVNQYCHSQIVQNSSNVSWNANTYRQCMLDREYPRYGEAGPGYFDDIPSVEDAVYRSEFLNCDYVYRNSKHTDPYGYLQCYNNIGIPARANEVTSVMMRNDDLVALKTYNNRNYVVAENNGGGTANANRTAIGPWETFTIARKADGRVAFRTGAGFYLIANDGGGSSITAHSTYFGEYESFTPVYLGNQKFAFKTYNGNYMRAYDGGGSTLDAQASAASIWETFAVEAAPMEGRLRNKHSGKCLDVYQAATGDFAKIVQWDCGSQNNQRFLLTKQSDGYYQMKLRHSGKCVDVDWGSTNNQAKIIQYGCHTGNNQRWNLEHQDDGSYVLVAKHSGKAIDVYGAATNNGADVVQWDKHNGNNQRFFFERI